MSRSPYETLGVREGASREECQAAFKSRVKELHPDKFRNNPDKLRESEKLLKEVNEAYHLLKSNDFNPNFRNEQQGSS